MPLPPDHDLRAALNDEVHARPPSPMVAPLRVSYLALVCDTPREAGWAAMRDLLARYGLPPPPPGSNHHRVDIGAFRVRWESHSEFYRFKFLAPGDDSTPFARPALAEVPTDFLAALPGRVMTAAHVALLPERASGLHLPAIAALFSGHAVIGSAVAGGAAAAYTDLQIHADGFSRFLLLDRSMTPAQGGRTVQRLLEIDTYRMLALLALGVARELAPFLRRQEAELAAITQALVTAGEPDEEKLLQRLTLLEAQVESRAADNLYRFSASRAYDDLVRRRTGELREIRIEGLPTFGEFIDRRLAPAMEFCRSVAARQDALAERAARATQLLSTRVDVTREQQTHAVLESLNRRAQLQLRLQSTVEGLSIAAVTYYVSGLVGYLAKGLKAGGLHLDPEIAIAASIPVVAAIVAIGLRKTRRLVGHE